MNHNNPTIKERLTALETEMIMIKKVLITLVGGTALNIGFTIA